MAKLKIKSFLDIFRRYEMGMTIWPAICTLQRLTLQLKCLLDRVRAGWQFPFHTEFIKCHLLFCTHSAWMERQSYWVAMAEKWGFMFCGNHLFTLIWASPPPDTNIHCNWLIGDVGDNRRANKLRWVASVARSFICQDIIGGRCQHNNIIDFLQNEHQCP